MMKNNISAYIITSSDDHQSEYVGLADERLKFVTGFTGSEGHAVITSSKAALWTDSRYHLQADQQMDCNWYLMRSGVQGVPTMQEWIVTELKRGDFISADPKVIPYLEWLQWNTYFNYYGISMNLIRENLVDMIWDNRPTYPNGTLTDHPLKYTGETWQSKLVKVRQSMKYNSVDACIITGLDEIAWSLNLRGSDQPYTPVFRSYLIITNNSSTLYLPSEKINSYIENYLSSSEHVVKIVPYERIWHDLAVLGSTSKKVWVPSVVGYAKGASYLVYQLIPDNKTFTAPSPIVGLMAYKNDVEAEGMLNAHIRDAVAICELWQMLERELQSGVHWDELKVASVLAKLRGEQPLNKGESFQSIVSFGTNTALPHYIPTVSTYNNVDNSSLLMIDSGGQYLDGTIDTTRVFSFGNPTPFQRKVYTALLQGCINLATTIFPRGTIMQDLENIIRQPLHNLGLQYTHGSTHGIGVYLAVHESFNYTYDINFFGSQEPGYYKENDFGIRLENVVQVISADTNINSKKNYLTFQAVTLVPYDRKLIDVKTLDLKQLYWINTYNKRIRKLVGDEMLKQAKYNLYQWMIEKTDHVYRCE